MKKIALALVSTALVSSAAMAADGASFTGFNLGANLGWSVGSSRFTANQTVAGDTDTFANDLASKGAVGGLSVGYGKQFGKGYLGLEAWGSLSNTNGTVNETQVRVHGSQVQAVALVNNKIFADLFTLATVTTTAPSGVGLVPVPNATVAGGVAATIAAVNPAITVPGVTATVGVPGFPYAIAASAANRVISESEPQSMTNTLSLKVQRRNEMGLSLKAGYVWGNAMAYATMGISSASFKHSGTLNETQSNANAVVTVPLAGVAANAALRDSNNNVFVVGSALGAIQTTPTTQNLSTTKRVMGFVPGLGVDVKVTNNVSLGMKVTHTFYRNHNIAGASIKHQVTDVRPSITYTW